MVTSFALFSQTLKWNPTHEVKGNETQYYAGAAAGKTYFVYRSLSIKSKFQLVEFSSDYTQIKVVELKELAELVNDIDVKIAMVVLSDNEIKVIYKVGKIKKNVFNVKFAALIYNLNGIKKNEVVLLEEHEEMLSFWDLNKELRKSAYSDMNLNPIRNVILSANGDQASSAAFIGIYYFADSRCKVRHNKFVTFTLKDLKQVNTIPLESLGAAQCFLLNTGELITMEGDEVNSTSPIAPNTGVELKKYSVDGTVKSKLSIPLKPISAGEFRNDLYYQLSDDQKSFYVAVNFASTQKTHTVSQTRFPISTIQLEKISIDNMKSVTVSIVINEKTIEDAGAKNSKGIPYFKICQIAENGSDLYVIAQTKKIEQSSSTTAPTTIITCRHQIVFKSSGTGALLQNVVKVDFSEFHLGVSSLFHNDKLYLIYNDKSEPNMEINVVQINDKLEAETKISEPTWKPHNIYIEPSSLHKIADNQYVFFGRMQKYVGSAILEFK